MILEQFDDNKVAVLNPWNIISKLEGMPKTIVSFFEHKLFNLFVETYKPEIIGEIGCATQRFPIYKTVVDGQELAVIQASVGAPACVSFFEELVVLGVENILLFGSCGSLVDFKEGSVIVPHTAVRDEGTSYHYAPPSDEIELDKNLVNKLCKFFDSKNVKYEYGKTWTTDAFYRETRNKVEKRKEAGCICVEMECAGMTAFAKFRGINFVTFFYTGDSLAGEEWNEGILSHTVLRGKDTLIPLSLEAAIFIYHS